ncbi:hypothetical protein L3Q82_016471 [Scortum barcoo]|uniref:Uncharacterized protein n=1 Tax=Scortum barcoo TaxID=214431 RepID=A0ACB8X9C5_9TELE|nr:hypothetical protein L3Q82_016471 [Scortum barcoo]
MSLWQLAWERLGVPPEELEEVSGVREVWASLLRLLPPRPGPGPRRMKKMKMKIFVDPISPINEDYFVEEQQR